MIKRSDGVEIMNARTKNVSLAKETLEILKQKRYTSLNGNVVDISNSLDAAVKGTVLYKVHVDLPDTDWETIKPTIEVSNETTAQAAVRLMGLGKTNLVALNFASARNQGGGFLGGAIAQEEDLCRCSGLYNCLKSKPVFYNENILCDHSLYLDNIIYSPKVPFFRNENNLLLEEPFELSIISSPAPNLTAMSEKDRDSEGGQEVIYSTLYSRAKRILHVAAANGHKNIILGAWGCGVFGNDPEQVASIFNDTLRDVPAFEYVCFAVYDARTPPHVFEKFKEVFK